MEVTAFREWGDLGPYRKPETRGGTEPEPDRLRMGEAGKRSLRLGCTGEEGGDSSVPDSGWIVTDGVTVLVGANAVGCLCFDVVVILSLRERLVDGLRGGVEGSCKSSEVAMGSSCKSSPLKSVMMPLSVECQADSDDSLGRGRGVLEDAAAMTLFKSTSLTLILRRLFLG